jgi:alpha-L-arabinofuranosidase
MYGFWLAGHMSANQYAEKHNRIVKAMRKVDPTIKVTSAGATPAELPMTTQENKQFIPNFWWPPFPNDLPHKFESINDYDYWMLKNGADYIDHVSEHTYCYPELSFDRKHDRPVVSPESKEIRGHMCFVPRLCLKMSVVAI